MKYNLTQDRVAINGDDSNFPYPLKLWYDDENIYVKVIRIPKYYELKLSKFAMKLKDMITNGDHDDYKSETAISKHMSNNAYLNHLSIFIETKQTSMKHCAYSRRKEIGNANVVKHKFCGLQLNMEQIQAGMVYSIQIHNVLTSKLLYIIRKRHNVNVTVRASFRYNINSERTGVNSNLATITYYE